MAKKRDDKEDLKQELNMLLGGRRKKYAADMVEGKDPVSENARKRHTGRIGGHGSMTYSEQFTEPEDETMATNAEERALLRERDRLDPYANPTKKMRVQDKAREAIAEEFRRRRK